MRIVMESRGKIVSYCVEIIEYENDVSDLS